ncbi:coiled-coil domain-containing protein 15 isoform X2 [Lagopus muta]|nr:coiled-coil domain-containing protein 15 isoform X2 [Lagopus muta]XP_048824277.1 coiled-coil domain-containing protein 15 isoform X2 [Lagopus muta]XP_048824278.1 coiled-coil domain-containing protein 15 isoform X2 [Lagopus muta]XP_048824279.1 coiled-coil domain-containing protein 15 isoform X2 [Lagopus muta]
MPPSSGPRPPAPRGALGRPARPPRTGRALLGERSLRVAPVGAWVESGPREQSRAFASAFQVEEELKEQQRRKAMRLRHFQGEVKRRVNQQLKMRRKQQLQRSCEATEKEINLAVQCLGSVLQQTPQKNTCVFRSRPLPAICSPAALAQQEEHGVPSEPFQQQAAQLSRAMRQVRRRLASCRTVPKGMEAPELPGGTWTHGQRQDESVLCAPVSTEYENEELILAGHHDLPAELKDQMTAPHQAEQDDDFYIKVEFRKFSDGSAKDLSSPESLQRTTLGCRAPLVLWAGIDQEESKKQRRIEYLRCRRLFMSAEREQVKEQQRQKERQRRIAGIKSKKESQRQVEEQRMQEVAKQQKPFLGDGVCKVLAQLELEERRLNKVKQKEERNKEYTRYVEALRAEVKEKMKLYNINLPPLCSCSSDFWESHPDTCANNCIFYKNHKAYSQALQSVISSCDLVDGRQKLPLCHLAALCTCPAKL